MIFTDVQAATAAKAADQTVPALAIALLGVTFVLLVAAIFNRHYRNSRDKDEKGNFVGQRRIDVTFARVVGLLAIAAFGLFGLVLALIVPTDLVTAYFTLLGTISGYLIGAKTGTAESTTTTETDSNGNPTGLVSTTIPVIG